MEQGDMAAYGSMFKKNMGVSKNRGTPKWMVKIMENPIKIDDLGVPLFLETPISIYDTSILNDVDMLFFNSFIRFMA